MLFFGIQDKIILDSLMLESASSPYLKEITTSDIARST